MKDRRVGVVLSGGGAKAAAQDMANEEDWTDRIEAWGDFRARYETFSYSDEGDFVDSDGNGIFDDRHRFRYRLRLNVKGKLHEYADVFVDLCGRESDALFLVHGFEHVLDQFGQPFVKALNGAGLGPQPGIGKLEDFSDCHKTVTQKLFR